MERRAGAQTTRAQKEKQRKQKQKAAQRQAAQGVSPGAAQQQQQPQGGREQQQPKGRGDQQQAKGPSKTEATAMAEAIAFVTGAATQQSALSLMARTASWQGKTWQVIVPRGTVAAGLDDATLGEALASARDEQRRQQLLNVPQQVPQVPQAQRSAFGAPAFSPAPALATPTFGAPAKSTAQGQFSGFGRQ